MKGYFHLTFNAENSIIIFGKRLGKNKIIFNGKPSFFDAIRFSDSSPPQDIDYSSLYIPVTCTPNKTYHFHDPLLYTSIKFIIDHNKLIIIDNDNILTSEAVYNIFKSLLIKKGKKMLFLTDVPNNKVITRNKDKLLCKNNEKNIHIQKIHNSKEK
jgi:hypothetical protein